ncbi:hypothetical protein [uncultured Tateyamaria sp.]|uniref:hypothetical protein n=1 Tax=uncultured Tateyamaria sp. TaxID=455651 RepID=UPI002636E6B2|nr:hypothetical protein [uncultured Tateyamaria sp.]
MAKKRIAVTSETSTGLNTRFNVPGQGELTRGQLADRIQQGLEPGYHVQKLPDGRRIPRSNPNGKESDNLG